MAIVVSLASMGVSVALQAAEPPTPAPSEPLGEQVYSLPPAPLELGTWNEVLSTLRARSPDLHISDQQIEVSRGQHTSRVGQDLPQVIATGTVRRDLLSGRVCDQTSLNCVDDVTAYSATLGLVQHVFDPSDWAGIRAASYALEGSRLDALDERRALTLTALDAIAQVLVQGRLADSARSAVKDSADRLELVRQAITLGSLPPAESVRAQQDLAVTFQTVVEKDDNVVRAQEALGSLLGYGHGVGIRAEFDLRSITRSCQPGAPQQRADVSALRSAAQAADSEIQRTGLRMAPVVDFISAFTLSSIPFVDDRHRSLLIGGNVTVPLWEGTQRWGELRTARARAAQAAERATAAAAMAANQQEQAHRRLQLAEQAVRAARETHRLAVCSEGLSRAALKVGSGTVLDLIDAGRRLRESQAVLVAREIELVVAGVRDHLVSARCTW